MNKKIFAISIIVLLFDQVSKILSNIYLKDNIFNVIPNFFSLEYAENTGAAWSILKDKQLILIISTLILIVLLHIFMRTIKQNNRNIIAFSLVYGGVWGNFIDRLFHGYVIDFLSFKIINYDFPIFNIADMAVVIGIFLMIIAILRGEDNEVDSRRRNTRKTR